MNEKFKELLQCNQLYIQETHQQAEQELSSIVVKSNNYLIESQNYTYISQQEQQRQEYREIEMKLKLNEELNQNIQELANQVTQKLEELQRKTESLPKQDFIMIMDQVNVDQEERHFPQRVQLETGFGPLKLDLQKRNQDFDKYLGGIVEQINEDAEIESQQQEILQEENVVELESTNNQQEEECIFDQQFDKDLEKYATNEKK